LQFLAISVLSAWMTESPATPVVSCPECRELRAALAEARKLIAELQAELHELRAQLNRNSSNSSSPPSVDPPGAPKPVVKTPTGRKPGGQPGHQGHHRHRLPPERVNKIVPYLPTVCDHCQAPLSAEPGPGDPEPTWHQVAELPELGVSLNKRHQSSTGLTSVNNPALSPRHALSP
jgi:transposase